MSECTCSSPKTEKSACHCDKKSPEAEASGTATPVDSPPENAASEIETLLKSLEEKHQQLLRIQADLDNFRKRTLKEKEEWRKLALSSFIEGLLPILDHFTLGLEAAIKEQAPSDVIKGFSLVYEQFEQFLKMHNIQCINPVDQDFDPLWHDCVSSLPHENLTEGKIIKVLRPGYSLEQKLIRPASVIVSKGPDDPKNPSEA